MAWNSYSCMSIYWGLFALNNGLHVDLVNLQMLQCIICRLEQSTKDVLVQICILHKGLIAYNKVNGITPMITHVQIAHPKLFALRKKITQCDGITCYYSCSVTKK
jgi:hypothetical protein